MVVLIAIVCADKPGLELGGDISHLRDALMKMKSLHLLQEVELERELEAQEVSREAKELAQVQHQARNGAMAMDVDRIALFTFIFGERAATQPWLPVWAKSCEGSGLGIDYYIVGDQVPPFKLPRNVHHIKTSWPKLVHKISERLFDGGRLEMVDAEMYKVIDIKPSIGFLFREHIQTYKWWGHVDNDMLMGDVRKALPQELLDKYDVIPGLQSPKDQKFTTWGPFTMYGIGMIPHPCWHLKTTHIRFIRAIQQHTSQVFTLLPACRFVSISNHTLQVPKRATGVRILPSD
jgi:hypothetical protein